MVEWVAIAILVSASVTGYFSLKSIRQTEKAMKRQAKINSIRLLAEIDATLRQERFKVVEAYIYGDSQTKPDDDILVRYLNQLDMYAVYWEEELLTTHHVTEKYRNLLVKIRDNQHIRNFMEKKDEKYKRKLYLPLQKLWDEF